MKIWLSFAASAIIMMSTAQSMAQLQTPQGPRGDENITNSGGPGAGEGKRRTHTMPAIELKSYKPPLRLTQQERQTIADAMTRQHTYQRTPKGFQPRIGMTVEKGIKLNSMPRPLIYEVPRLRQYSYAKLERNVLVIDPMSMKVVDVVPRKLPVMSTPTAPIEWWATRGRKLIGLPPAPVPETTGAGAQRSASGTPARAQQAVPAGNMRNNSSQSDSTNRGNEPRSQ